MEITVFYLKIAGINCLFDGLTWNYLLIERRNVSTIHSSVKIAVFVLLESLGVNVNLHNSMPAMNYFLIEIFK
jgi:hypothetical protein